MLEVAVPAAQSRIESRNNVRNGVPLVTFRLGADVIAQGHQTLLAYPTLPCFKPVPQKLEPLTLDTAVPNMGLVRMQRQSVRTHPGTHSGQRRLRFLPTATQHHGVISVAHHHQPSLTHFDVKLVKVNVGEQGANHCPLRTARHRCPPLHVFHDVLLEKPLNELQHPTICNSLSHFREKGRMWNRVKVVLQVRVHHPEVARFQMPVHFTQRIFAAQTLPKAEAPRLEFVLKDRLDHQFQGRLNYAVLHSRYTEWTSSARIGYVHTSYRLRTIAPVLQRSRQFGQVKVPCLRESFHAHPVYSRRPGVPFDLCPSQPQRFKTRYFIDQTMPFAALNSSL